MRFSRLLFERGSIDGLVAGMESNLRWVKRGDHHKRQGGLLDGIIGGGVSLIGDILNPNEPKTTTQAQPPRTTNPPATTAATTQAPPATTRAPAPPATIATTVAPPVRITTAPVPTFQQPAPSISSSSRVTQPSRIPIAIPISTTIRGDRVLPGTTLTLIPLLPSASLSPSSPNLSSRPLSSITSNISNQPTTFSTSTLTTSTSTLSVDDSTTANPIMGDSSSGTEGMNTMTIIISVIVITFGSLAIFLLAFFISKNYIRKRKITIAMETRISQIQNQQQGPLPPVPMRMKMNEAMTFFLRFPSPPSIRGMGRSSREREREGFQVMR